jgi:hypothetical protein
MLGDATRIVQCCHVEFEDDVGDEVLRRSLWIKRRSNKLIVYITLSG